MVEILINKMLLYVHNTEVHGDNTGNLLKYNVLAVLPFQDIQPVTSSYSRYYGDNGMLNFPSALGLR